MKRLFLFTIALGLLLPGFAYAATCPGATTTTNLVSQYEAENNTDDAVGSNDATLVNGATYTTGYLGSNAFFLDGSNDRVSMPLSAYSGVSQASWGGWFKKDTNPGSASGRGLITAAYTGGGNIAHALQFFVGNQSLYAYIDHTNNYVKGGEILDTEWHHVMVVFDGTQTGNNNRLRIYIDGIYTDAGNTGGTIPATMSFPQFYVGADGVYTSFETWDGSVDRVRFYNDALTAYEVKTMYINESGGCSPLTGETTALSDSEVDASSDYTISFVTPGGVDAGQTVTLTFPAGFDLSSIDYTDIDVAYDDGSVTELTLGSVQSGSTWGVSVSDQDLIVRSETGTIPAGATITIEIGTNATVGTTGDQQIVNPSIGNIYDLDINSTFGDAGTAEIAITDDNMASVTLSSISATAPNVLYAIDITPGVGIEDQGIVILNFPSNFDPSFDSLTSGDIAVSGPNISSATKDIDTTANTIELQLTTTGTVTEEFQVVIGDGAAGGLSDLTNPTAGIYAIGVDTYDSSDVLLAQGHGLAEVDNAVQLTAIITEALIMTLTNSGGGSGITLQVDPAVNDGQDLSESTTLTISSNALNGYNVKAELDDGSGNARLINASGDPIESNFGAGDNYFSYTARNNATGSGVTAEQDFSANPADLLDASSETIGLSTVTNSQAHTVNYDLNVNYLTPAGVYTGTVYYTVVANF